MELESTEIQSSEVFIYSSMRLQVHVCKNIADEITLRKIWEKITQKVAFSQCKSQPCAWRVRDKVSGLFFEQYKDNGSIGTGNKMLRLLKKRKVINMLICVFITQALAPLNPSIDHSSIISAINVTFQFFKIEYS